MGICIFTNVHKAMAGRCTRSGGVASLRRDRLVARGSQGMHRLVQVLSRLHAVLVREVSRQSRPSQLRHAHVISRAHQHVQELARQAKTVLVLFLYIVVECKKN